MLNLAEKQPKISKSKHGGARPNAGGPRKNAGRKPGVPNLLTADLKNMIMQALQEEGGVKYLRTVAQTDQRAFCGLIGKLVPTVVAGDKDNPLEILHSILGSFDGTTRGLPGAAASGDDGEDVR